MDHKIYPFNVYNSMIILADESVQFSSVAQLCPTLYDPTNRSTPGLPASPTAGVHSNSRPSSRWCHSAISSSVVPFSSCPQSLQASGSFPMSQLFTWGGQSTGVSALASNEHPGLISFRMNWLDLLAVQGTLKCSSWVQSQKQQNDLCSFPRQTIQYHSNPSLCSDQ